MLKQKGTTMNHFEQAKTAGGWLQTTLLPDFRPAGFPFLSIFPKPSARGVGRESNLLASRPEAFCQRAIPIALSAVSPVYKSRHRQSVVVIILPTRELTPS